MSSTPHRYLASLLAAHLLLAVAVFAMLPALALAQGYELRVSIHDASGQPLAGVALRVRDERGIELAHALTNATGTASFRDLPAVVRVAVDGQPPNGPQLFQLGDDVSGVRMDLSQAIGVPVLDLGVERDGLVLPDPRTMMSLEEGGPTVAAIDLLPTALLATPAPLPTTSLVISATAGVVRVDGVAATGEPAHDSWVPLATALVIVVALVVMRVVQRRRSAR
jgi:hypothetical protein